MGTGIAGLGAAAVLFLLVGCGGGGVAGSSSNSPSVAEDPDQVFATASGLSGSALSQGIIHAQAMCAQMADADLKGSPLNGAMQEWMAGMEVDLTTLDQAKGPLMNLGTSAATAYCPEYLDGVKAFFS